MGLDIYAFESWARGRVKPSDLIADSGRSGMATESMEIQGAPNGRPFYLVVASRGVRGQFSGNYDLRISRSR